MEAVLDSLRRIISRWTKTAQPLIQDYTAGSDLLVIRTTRRFQVGDEILVRGPTQYEKPAGLRITEVVDKNTLRINTPLTHNWLVSDGSVVAKLIQGNLVEGIYLGDPTNIPAFPAITVNPISMDVEPLHFEAFKYTYNVEIGVFAEDSGDEKANRFVYRLTKLIHEGLMNNLFPLVNDYETSGVIETALVDTNIVKVADSSIFACGQIVNIEDMYKSTELRVNNIIDANTIEVHPTLPATYEAADGPILILVKRFIYNSYPKAVQFGKVPNSLLKGAVIDWFGEEEVTREVSGGRRSDTQIE